MSHSATISSSSNNKKEKAKGSSYNTCIKSKDNDEYSSNNNHSRIGTPSLQINTDPLGLSFLSTHKSNSSDTTSATSDDIFKQLNFPHLKRQFVDSSSPTSSDSSLSSSTASSPRRTTTRSSDNLPIKNKVALSPAASFLAGFMTSPSQAAISNASIPSIEEDGDTHVITNYTMGDIIGFGGFSTVRKAQHDQHSSNNVAVKIINQYLMNDIERLRLERELSIWKSLHHPRIVQLKRIIHANEKCYIVCDYCSKGNLLNHLNNVKRLNEIEAKKIFKEICQGVYYLHIDRKVCHKDLKLENILLDDQYHVKICDFGLAIYQTTKRKIIIKEMAGGSLAYASPEQIKQKVPLTCPKTDIWSLGVILYALVVGSLPFMDTFELRLQKKILKGQFELPNELSLPLQQLIQHCLHYNPDKRWTVDQVLNSTWLKK